MIIDEGVRAVVTGGGSGLGRALSIEVARRGGRVLVADVDTLGAEGTVDLIRQAGGEAWPVRCDVSRYESVSALIAVAEARMGGVELIANNAGVALGGALDTLSLADWRWIVDVNLWGVIHGCHAFLPYFKSRGRGHVLNVASAAGLLNPPRLGAYNLTKSGVIALSETLHAEMHERGIGVTVLCPTYFPTKIHEAGRNTDPRGRERILRAMERSKWTAEDVARVALDAVGRGELYCLPMPESRLAWALKRAIPGHFHRIGAFGRRLAKRGIPRRQPVY